ncbi:MAG TPA: alpha/beta fold hydrolase [Chloroflexota bacterium]|nr:alpha/beta fold hydrolase [Chloroflexota bacterium]HUM67557.1 alpha/beta fold hydrolase [Chloroflexota bacterium]
MSTKMNTITKLENQPSRRKTQWQHWFTRGLVAVILVLVALAMIGASYQAVAARVDRRNYPPPGQLVDVGGYQLHIYCQGEGSPTVLLDEASIDTVSDWVWIQPEVAHTTRVCAYDRAGLGWSDLSPSAPDAVQNTAALHTLLQTAGIEAPYILVGHSFGGLYARAFADEYAGEVAGLVLIEPFHPDNRARLGLAETMPNAPDEGQIAVGQFLSRFGFFRLVSFAPVDAALPQQQQQELHAYYTSPKYLDQVRAITGAFPALLAQVRETGDLADRPLTVVLGTASENWTGEMRTMQDEITGLSVNGRQYFVEGADHLSLVHNQEHARHTAQAVLEMVELVRSN